MRRVVSLKPMPWSHFTNGAFPGSSRAVFGRPARDQEGPRPGAVHFFTPGGPRATFNFNLKVTRAPARNIPRIKPVNSPAGARRGPCRDPPGKRGQYLRDSTQDSPPPRTGSLRELMGSWLDLYRGPGWSSAGAFRMSERVPVGTIVWFPGGYTVTERRIYQCSINQSINKLINQFRLTWINLHHKMYTNSPVLYFPYICWYQLKGQHCGKFGGSTTDPSCYKVWSRFIRGFRPCKRV